MTELTTCKTLGHLISDPNINEILINKYDQIYFEKFGEMFSLNKCFLNQENYYELIEKLCQTCGSFINRDKPFLEMQKSNMRITIIHSEIARGSHLLSIRKKVLNETTLTHLQKHGWCNLDQLNILQSIIKSKKNFLVVGGTSSGKTTALQALISEIDPQCRNIIIEDTQELSLPNGLSTSLLTKIDTHQNQNTVTMTDLLKRALRLRPDRLIIGEIRGGEATDLLMALSTGHDGSFGSLHARNQQEALLRLEMLIQMGAPQWQTESIRRLIGLTIKYIFVVKKENDRRVLEGIYKITSVENHGITTMKIESTSDLEC